MVTAISISFGFYLVFLLKLNSCLEKTWKYQNLISVGNVRNWPYIRAVLGKILSGKTFLVTFH